MGKFKHALVHLGIMALTGVVTFSGVIPGKYAPVAVAAGGLAQAILALINHPAKAE